MSNKYTFYDYPNDGNVTKIELDDDEVKEETINALVDKLGGDRETWAIAVYEDMICLTPELEEKVDDYCRCRAEEKLTN